MLSDTRSWRAKRRRGEQHEGAPIVDKYPHHQNVSSSLITNTKGIRTQHRCVERHEGVGIAMSMCQRMRGSRGCVVAKTTQLRVLNDDEDDTTVAYRTTTRTTQEAHRLHVERHELPEARSPSPSWMDDRTLPCRTTKKPISPLPSCMDDRSPPC